jgi:para-nitrobenzyl esterase
MSRRWAGEYVQILRQMLESRGKHDAAESAEALAVHRTAHQLLTTALPSDLVAACTVLQIRTPDAYPGTFCLAPVIDGDFLPDHPLRAFREGTAHRVPLIIGTNNREGAIFRGRVDILPRTPPRIEALFARAPAGSRRRMRAVYPGLPTRRAAADFGGDFGFWFPSTRVTDYHSRFAPTWAYRFDVAPRLLEILGLDATHGVEMFALFARTDLAMARLITAFGGAEEYAAAGQRMRTMWLRFAAGAPPEETWPSYREPDRSTLIIDETDRVEHDPRRARRRAWEQFLPDTAW